MSTSRCLLFTSNIAAVALLGLGSARLLAASTPAHNTQARSQETEIRGQVVDSLTGLPVGAGFVVLLDGAGGELDRILTGPDGRFVFRIAAGRSGPFTLRSERIGFGLAVSAPVALRDRGVVDVTIATRALSTPLSAIEVRETTECRVRPGTEAQTAVVWEEARKALAAASWTAGRQSFRIVSNVYDVDLDRRRRVVEERHRPSIGNRVSPFVSLDPMALLHRGYVEPRDGALTYYAPDAEVLQHDGFLATHCFRLEAARENDESLIGLRFDPAPSRDLPDVAGVLWLDRETSELRLIEYHYVNLPRELRANETGGGTIEFMPLPSGAWIVHRWSIGIPTRFREERVDRFDRFPRRFADAFRDSGGEVLRIRDASGAEVYKAVLAEVTGTVMDSTGATPVPLAGAVVRVVDTWFADTTDRDGRFRVEAPLDGEYSLALTHPRTDSLAVALPDEPVTLTRGRVDTVALAVPSLATIATRLCPDQATGGNYRILVGTVRDSATGRPVPGIPVVANWQDIRSDFTQYRNVRGVATTDERGTYTLCGLQVSRPALIFAARATGRSDIVRVSFEPRGVEVGDRFHQTDRVVWRRDLVVPHGRMRATEVAGLVTDAATGTPILEARVTVGSAGYAVTDSTGLFRVVGVESARQTITVRRPGYRTRRAQVEVLDDQPTLLGAESVVLQPVPQIVGRVTNSVDGQPVPGVLMTLGDSVSGDVAAGPVDSAGYFAVTAPQSGVYRLTATRIGFRPQQMGPFTLEPGHAVRADLLMEPLGFVLDPLEVTAEAVDAHLSGVGFYRRQIANRGYFMNPEDVRRRAAGASNVGQMLSVVPGLTVIEGVPGKVGSRIQISRGYMSCPDGPRIFVDDLLIENKVIDNYWDALGDVVQPEQIVGIEVYRSPSQIPAQYGGAQSACGVILIWTFRGGR